MLEHIVARYFVAIKVVFFYLIILNFLCLHHPQLYTILVRSVPVKNFDLSRYSFIKFIIRNGTLIILQFCICYALVLIINWIGHVFFHFYTFYETEMLQFLQNNSKSSQFKSDESKIYWEWLTDNRETNIIILFWQ